MRKALFSLIIFIPLTGLLGCETIHYYSQAIGGQFSILAKRQPIDKVINSPDTNEEHKEKLKIILETLAFAEEHLSLPAHDQYRTYVDLGRSYAVWNVVAADKLSLKPYLWCYPVLGCMNYRGYFKKSDALAKARALEAEGYDVYTRSVAAYSTLGWFRDPVLSSFIHYDAISLRSLLFHELAHQVVYLEGDTTFNESFAVSVEMEGMRRWYEVNNDPEGYAQYQERLAIKKQFISMVDDTRQQLKALYDSNKPTQLILQEKAAIQEQLRQTYRQVRDTQWGGKKYYGKWFEGPLNNAQLNGIATYSDLVPGFQGLIHKMISNDQSLTDFYDKSRAMQSMEKEKRHQWIIEHTGNKLTFSDNGHQVTLEE